MVSPVRSRARFRWTNSKSSLRPQENDPVRSPTASLHFSPRGESIAVPPPVTAPKRPRLAGFLRQRKRNSALLFMLSLTASLPAQAAVPPPLKIFEQDGRKIYYSDTGSGSTVLLLHGYASDHTDWRHQIPVLSKRYRVIAPDMAFFGKSDPGPLPHTTKNHAADCVALLDRLGIEQAVVVGHSMGGFIARDIYLTAPERVTALVEVDNDGMVPALSDLSKLLNVYRPKGREYRSAFNVERLKRYEKRKAELREQFGGASPRAFHESTPQGKWCNVPLLSIFTSRQAYSQDDIPDNWARVNFPTERPHLVIIRDSAHWVMLEQPDLVTEALLDFLGKLD